MLIGLTFINLHTKLYDYLLLQILITHFSANRIPQTRTISSVAWEWTTIFCLSFIVVHVNASWNMSKDACVHEFPWLNTNNMLLPFQKLNCRTVYFLPTTWNYIPEDSSLPYVGIRSNANASLFVFLLFKYYEDSTYKHFFYRCRSYMNMQLGVEMPKQVAPYLYLFIFSLQLSQLK
jgi:hypothetical protein